MYSYISGNTLYSSYQYSILQASVLSNDPKKYEYICNQHEKYCDSTDYYTFRVITNHVDSRHLRGRGVVGDKCTLYLITITKFYKGG